MTMIQFKFLIVAFLPSATFAAVYDDRDKVGIPLLSKVQALGLTTAIAKQKVLSGAEKAKLFSKLEKQKAFSSAEKLLPTVDKLGLLQFAQETIDTSAGESFVKGVGLVALAPIYAALVKEGFLQPDQLPESAELAPAVLLTATTGAGVLLIAASSLIGQLQAPKVAAQSSIPLLKRLGDLKISTTISDLKLLSAAEKAGVFSKLEKAGAFTTAENLLPKVDELGVLETTEKVLNANADGLFDLGAATAIAAGVFTLSVMGVQGIAPGNDAVLDTALPLLVLGTGGGAGIVIIVTSAIVGYIQEGEYKKPPPPTPAPAPAPKKVASQTGTKLLRQRVKARAFNEAPVPQYNSILQRPSMPFNPALQRPSMPFMVGPRAQAPLFRGPLAEIPVDTNYTNIFAVMLISLFAGSGFAFAYNRLRKRTSDGCPTTTTLLQ